MSRVYIVGRENRTKPCDITLPEHLDAVSRQHLEITEYGTDRFQVVDISGNGTEVLDGASWRRLTHEHVRGGTPLRLGKEYETTVNDLLSYEARTRNAPRDEERVNVLPRGRGGVYLDPNTGEIVNE